MATTAVAAAAAAATVATPTPSTPYGNLNWEQYRHHRPAYPPSCTGLVYRYRQAQAHARWERLVDLGGGVGNAAVAYIKDFAELYETDPSAANQNYARTFLAAWLEQQRPQVQTRVEFAQCTGEAAFQHIGENTADLVICATAAHFTDPDALVASIAKMLRPGGTLAIYGYWVPTFPDQSERFNAAFITALGNAMLEAFPPGQSQEMVTKVQARITAGLCGQDYIPLPPGYFIDPQRIRINPSKQDVESNTLLRGILAGDIESLPSRVADNEPLRDYHTGIDQEADGWTFPVDKEWLYGFINTVRASTPGRSEPGDELFKEWEAVFDKECPTGTVRTLWTAHMVLATRL